MAPRVRQEAPRTPRNLVISSNVDALLEHDERVRSAAGLPLRSHSPFFNPTGISSKQTPSFAAAGPVQIGLPPPPRRRSRKAPVVRADTDSDEEPRVTRSPEHFLGPWGRGQDRSPYRNPSPSPEYSQSSSNESRPASPGQLPPNPYINPPPNFDTLSDGSSLSGVSIHPLEADLRPTPHPKSPSASIRLRHKLFHSSPRSPIFSITNALPEIVPSPSLSESMASPWWSGESRTELASNANISSDTSSTISSTKQSGLPSAHPREPAARYPESPGPPSSDSEVAWSPPNTARLLDTPTASTNPFRNSQISQYSAPYSPLQFSAESENYINTRATNPKRSMSPDRESFIDLGAPISPKAFPDSPTLDNYAATLPDGQRSPISPATSELPNTTLLSNAKPPIPTTPKPTSFRILQNSSRTASASQPGHSLSDQERAERVKQSRKIAQVFGHPPANISVVDQALSSSTSPSNIVSKLVSRNTRHRGAVSISTQGEPHVGGSPVEPTTPEHATVFLKGTRRHSSPYNSEFSFLVDGRPLAPIKTPSTEEHSVLDIRHQTPEHDRSRSPFLQDVPDSPTSFFQLSDDEGANSPTVQRSLDQPFSPDLQELTPEEELEEERRRKREKLAKLHRFLGSRVPVDAVLGALWNEATPLPPISSSDSPTAQEEEEQRPTWIRRRRRSSFSAGYPTRWDDDVDRLKDDYNDQEKAINVRRAVKMEKMFGELPPQTLYHTRPVHAHVASTSVSPPMRPPTSPPAKSRNSNQTSYLKAKARKSHHRPGTAESEQGLLDQTRLRDASNEPSSSRDSHPASTAHLSNVGWATSDVYLHYRNSLLSLKDIIDRDDKQSLAELHDFMQEEQRDQPTALERQDTVTSLSSMRTNRRRSLPLRASNASLASQFSITVPKQEITQFQVRRRRAAKLQHFFGVQYRDLFGEVLDSLERGVEEESHRGSLRVDEYQDLVQKLRRLKMQTNDL